MPEQRSFFEREGFDGDKPEEQALAEAREATKAAGHPLEEAVVDALRSVYDPEIPVNIYELGLIYNVEFDDANRVHVMMTLTAPGCPVAGTLPLEVEERVRSVEGVTDATVELVWDPPWTPDFMSEAAKLELGMF